MVNKLRQSITTEELINKHKANRNDLNQQLLREKLHTYIGKKTTVNNVITNVTSSNLRHFLNGVRPDTKISRDTLIAIMIYLEYSLDEVNDLLQAALYLKITNNSTKRDQILFQAFERKWNLQKTNISLSEAKHEILDNRQKNKNLHLL